MVLVGALIIGYWTVLYLFDFFFVYKDMFLTNLTVNLYHELVAHFLIAFLVNELFGNALVI